LVTALDDFGEQQPGGMLPIPVGLILEEFPSLGCLDSLVRDINLVRKRRISVLTAAQTLAQFGGIYGRGTAWQKIIGCKSEYPKTYIAAPVSSQQRQVGHSLRLCVWRCGGGSRGRMTFSQKGSRKKAEKTRPPACPR
ncbi:MAG: type IV secretory system conjugative DNA transfer family protein, partial [Anaerolineae bacterium]|nr:type IV secretory system conjugative DNA transfer family protein [Anaerolineae bacterium]